MQKIQYEVEKGKTIEVEVTDEFAEQYDEILLEEKRTEWKEKKRNDSSLDVMTDAGFQVEDQTSNVENNFFDGEEKTALLQAIKLLTPEQQKLIWRVFYNGETQVSIAKEEGVTPITIESRLRRIYARLKNNLK